MTDHTSAGWREVGYRRSSFSGSSGGNCVEVARAGTGFAVRDSKDPLGSVLATSAEQGNALLRALKSDRFST